MGTYKAFPLEGKVGPKDPDEGEPAAAPPGAGEAKLLSPQPRRFAGRYHCLHANGICGKAGKRGTAERWMRSFPYSLMRSEM